MPKKQAAKKWEKFAVGTPSTAPAKWFEATCAPFAEVFHVAHAPAAVRIVADGHLRSDLVYDNSCLNTHRIRVVWLSPNDWHYGSRYGNVRFSFDWPSLVSGRRAFWVESIPYKPPACRILLTKNDYSNILQEYDPKASPKGPWWVSSQGKHYWNSTYCLEIMLDEDLPLCSQSLLSIDLVKHHATYCCIDPRTCQYLDDSGERAGAVFLASVAAQEIALPKCELFVWKRSKGTRILKQETKDTLDLVASWLGSHNPRFSQTGITATDPIAVALGRALLGCYVRGTKANTEATELMSLFSSMDETKQATETLLLSTIGM